MNRAQRRSNVDYLSTVLNEIRKNDFTYGYYIQQNGYHVIIIATNYDRYAIKYIIYNNDLIMHDIVKIDADINLQNFIHMHADDISSMTDLHFHSGSNTYNL